MTTMNPETKTKVVSPDTMQDVGANAPSGFILKLFQMVHGAPDEIISVSEEQFRRLRRPDRLAAYRSLVEKIVTFRCPI